MPQCLYDGAEQVLAHVPADVMFCELPRILLRRMEHRGVLEMCWDPQNPQGSVKLQSVFMNSCSCVTGVVVSCCGGGRGDTTKEDKVP